MPGTLSKSQQTRLLIQFAWAILLLISDLPNLLLESVFGGSPPWIFWGKVGVLAVSLATCQIIKALRPLRQFALIFLVFYLGLAGRNWLFSSAAWQNSFGGADASFTRTYLGIHIPDTALALVVLATLWLIKRKRTEFFLVKGQLDAPIGPVRWMGIKEGESWRIFGWIFTVCAGAAILATVILSVPLTADAMRRALPLLPTVLLLAGLNAFAEEAYYRCSLLSTLSNVTGNHQAIMMNVVFFGLAHVLAGSPPGLLGFALTGFLAYLLGKSILETRGIGWAWLMHFVPDVLIFFSYALAWG